MTKNLPKYYLVLFFILVVYIFVLSQTQFTPWPEMLLWPYLLMHGWLPYRDILIANGAGPGNDLPAYFIPGHINFPNIDPSTVLFTVPTFTFKRGPTPGCADVVVVCKTPEITSQMLEYYLSGEVGHVMRSALAEAGIPYFLDTAYVTGLVKHSVPGTLKQIFIKEASWLLWAELAIIRPKLVIALGSEPIKYFCGKSASVNSCRGMLQPHTITVGDEQISFNVLGTFSPNALF
jgi:uracil-DNA glycosylase